MEIATLYEFDEPPVTHIQSAKKYRHLQLKIRFFHNSTKSLKNMIEASGFHYNIQQSIQWLGVMGINNGLKYVFNFLQFLKKYQLDWV